MKKIQFAFLLMLLNLASYADKIAVIGGGASGLVSAFLLESRHEVTLFEANNRLGGHINTIPITVDGKEILIEGGAEFFNKKSYPHFLRLLNYLHIPISEYTLVSNFYTTDGQDSLILPPFHDGVLELPSLTLSNIYRMIQLKRVIDKGRKIIKTRNMDLLLVDFLEKIKLTSAFKNLYFYPFLASGWGVTPEDIKTTSAYISLKYIVEGNDAGNYKWCEAVNGLSSYIKAVVSSLKNTKILINSPITSIVRINEQYLVTTQQGVQGLFDHVVFATNPNTTADQLKQLPDLSDAAQTFSQVRYYDTKIAIHGDTRFMPPQQKYWRVVNIAFNGQFAETTIYKKWKSKTPIFRSWITLDSRIPNNLYAMIHYRHPHTDSFYVEAQRQVLKVQGYRNLWFAGLWTIDNDSHESAIISAVRIAEQLAPNTHRLRVLTGTQKSS